MSHLSRPVVQHIIREVLLSETDSWLSMVSFDLLFLQRS
jgi:hypothetical protein